jgi:SAM-dependent methyltransferase
MRMRTTVRDWCRTIPSGGVVLEIGGGTSMLRPTVQRELPDIFYVSGDISPTDATGVVLDAGHLPVRDGSIQTVLAFEVLEHIRDPQQLICEVDRVLAPGGTLILTTPFMYGVHDYRDYFRFTPLGLESLLDGTCLELQETVLRGGTFVSIVGLLKSSIRNAILGEPGDWRAQARHKKLLWAFVTIVETPWIPITWLAMGIDTTVGRTSRNPPGYFFRCDRSS